MGGGPRQLLEIPLTEKAKQMALTQKEAIAKGDELNLHMKNLFATAELRGGEITASGMGYEETIKHEDGRYLQTGKWLLQSGFQPLQPCGAVWQQQ